MWLSQKKDDLSERYDVIVIGSGYGGAIAASRFAQFGYQVCLLEKGREIVPGEYPNNTEQFLREVQADCPSGHFGSPSGLFDIRCYKNINVMAGCGLGGTSLIDAGVCARPDASLFQDAIWPEAIQNDKEMQTYYQRAEEMLRPSPYPRGSQNLNKFDSVQKYVKEMPYQSAMSRPPLLINFKYLRNGFNASGVDQRPCTKCGNCLTGCNEGAKNTLATNYLPEAKRDGVRIFTQIQVSHIEKDRALWRVFIKKNNSNHKKKSNDIILRSDTVILAAGSLGSTEILLRSSQKGLRLSPALGHRFSGNGNMIGMMFNTDHQINAVGLDAHLTPVNDLIGPSTTGMIDIRFGEDLQNTVVLSELTFPGAVSKYLPAVLASLGEKTGKRFGDPEEILREESRVIQSKIRGSYVGAVNHTQLLFATAHDNSGGRLIMEKDRVKVLWPGVERLPVFYRTNAILEEIAKKMGGTYIANPIWHDVLGQGLFTWNPLGGAVMADDAKEGVVNHKGQVYSSDRGLSVHEGLYVMDGSVIPRSLGVGPILTICALAERSCEHFRIARQ
jgi:cholesterol oxidase